MLNMAFFYEFCKIMDGIKERSREDLTPKEHRKIIKFLLEEDDLKQNDHDDEEEDDDEKEEKIVLLHLLRYSKRSIKRALVFLSIFLRKSTLSLPKT